MRKNFFFLALFSVLLFPSACFSQIIPNAEACMGIALNGQPMEAIQTTGPSNAWAVTSWPGGVPTITYSQPYFDLPDYMQRFTSLHECGHASTGNPDEFAANCHALRSGGWSQADVAMIASYHRGIGMLPPQYGGSGAAFWQGTLQECPEFAVSDTRNNFSRAPACPGVPPGYSLTCHFLSGARAGQVMSFCGMPATPVPIGGTCTDGFSMGVAE